MCSPEGVAHLSRSPFDNNIPTDYDMCDECIVHPHNLIAYSPFFSDWDLHSYSLFQCFSQSSIPIVRIPLLKDLNTLAWYKGSSKPLDCDARLMLYWTKRGALCLVACADPDYAPAGGGGGGGCKGGDPKEFLVRHVSFFSFYELPPDQLDVDLNNLTPLSSAEPHTSHCERHEPYRSCLHNPVVEVFPSFQLWAIPEASSKWSLHCPVYCIINSLINFLAHLVGNIEILQVV
ncbi:hypothetical protein Tco_1175298 [Tanacetum coccineum]